MNPDDLLPKHVTAPVTREWSPEQNDIYHAAVSSNDNLLVEAVAGSGKSTSLIETSNRLNNKGLALAFNKAIADELGPKFPRATVRTFNALGHRVLMSKRPGAKFNQWKTYNWLKAHMSVELYEGQAKNVARLVSIAKGQGYGILEPIGESDFRPLIDSYLQDIAPDQISTVGKLAYNTFLAVIEDKNEFDYDDQLYVPVNEGFTFPAFDTIYPDEAQDLNPIQHMMLAKLADRGARIIAVGDRAQAIYGFRGALSSSMDMLQQTFLMKEFPLSTTYRCSQAVTRLAQQIVPQIQHRSNAPEGEVVFLDKYPEIPSYTNNDLIVCRNNGPIFKLALQFVKAHKPCRVLSNFLDEFDKFVETFKAKEIPILIDRLEAWYQKQKSDCEKRGAWGKLEGLTDKYDALKAFAPNFKTIGELLFAIKRLATSTVGPKIATIHKSKGLEAENVYLLRWDLLPSTRATTPEAISQEDNLRYVAITRAKLNLRILPLGD